MGKMEDAMQNMARNLHEKTGKSLKAWAKLARGCGQGKHKALVDWLKATHGLGHGYANLIAHAALAKDVPTADDDLVAAQYAGPKSALLPWYETLIAAVRGFGDDVEIAPKKTYVSLRRSTQFGLVQPSTATRLDVGIKLKGVAPQGRLEASGSFNAMVSHRVRVEKAGDIDKQLLAWLRRAYDLA
jgi:hypothetical protein